MWYESLNQAGVEASSALRKAESVYYPLAIRASVPSSSGADTAPEVAEMGKDNIANVPTSSNNPSEEAEQLGVTEEEKEKNARQGVAPDAMKPPTITQDPPTEKEAPKKMEIVLATLSLPTKTDPASKGPEALKAASSQPNKALPKEKLVIKKK